MSKWEFLLVAASLCGKLAGVSLFPSGLTLKMKQTALLPLDIRLEFVQFC